MQALPQDISQQPPNVEGRKSTGPIQDNTNVTRDVAFATLGEMRRGEARALQDGAAAKGYEATGSPASAPCPPGTGGGAGTGIPKTAEIRDRKNELNR